MSDKRYEGTIVRWKDERGFGFIQTNGIKKDIFLHISAIQRSSRRPQAGDIIYFDLQKEPSGKYKAINASFDKRAALSPKKTVPKQTIPRRNIKPSTRKSSSRQLKQQTFSLNSRGSSKLRNAVFVGLLLVGASFAIPRFLSSQSRQTATSNQSPTPDQSDQNSQQTTSTSTQSCNIKGNISYPDGEKFYHKPGYRDYDKVEIFENEGERWFCSEEEAVQAGWKDAAAQ